MTTPKDLQEIRELTEQIKDLSIQLRSVAEQLRIKSMYRSVRLWAVLMACMAISMGIIFFAGGQPRLTASAYFLVAKVGHDIWSIAFMVTGLLTALCVWKRSGFLRWALMLESVPYLGLAFSFALAAVLYPEANLTAAPVYAWVAIFHVFLSDFARKEFCRARVKP